MTKIGSIVKLRETGQTFEVLDRFTSGSLEGWVQVRIDGTRCWLRPSEYDEALAQPKKGDWLTVNGVSEYLGIVTEVADTGRACKVYVMWMRRAVQGLVFHQTQTYANGAEDMKHLTNLGPCISKCEAKKALGLA